MVRFVPWPVRDRAATAETLAVKLDQAELREPGQWLVLAVEQRETGRVIGEVLLKWASERQGELGFAFARDVHGQGYAAEAATAVLDLAFDGLGFHRVSAVVIEGNDGVRPPARSPRVPPGGAPRRRRALQGRVGHPAGVRPPRGRVARALSRRLT